jgi:putative membrane protein
MGSADIIPGVSGGTMALITGIYERLINGIKGLTDFIKPLVRFKLGKSVKAIKKIDW